jgi:hypothetical protein
MADKKQTPLDVEVENDAILRASDTDDFGLLSNVRRT